VDLRFFDKVVVFVGLNITTKRLGNWPMQHEFHALTRNKGWGEDKLVIVGKVGIGF